MNWKTGPGWNMQTSGDYAVTKHAIADKPGEFFYIGWWKQDVINGSCTTADDARECCRKHNEARS